MKITKFVSFVALGAIVIVASACSSSPSPTPPATRVATQTPWIIYQVVSPTPEPPTVTPLPTATEAKVKTPTRAATAKPAATAVKPTNTPAPVVVQPTAPPACNLGGVTLLFPENGAPRNTRKDGSGGSAFVFKWTPFQGGITDTQTGYRIDIDSKRGNTHVNGAVVYVSHNKFLSDGQQYIFDQRSVSQLAAGENATVTWKVTVVKTTGSFDDQGGVTGSVINCGPSSPTSSIQLIVPD